MAARRKFEITAESSPHVLAMRVAGFYALVGGLWVVFSDTLLGDLGLPPRYEHLIATTKGVLFVLVTAGIIYAMSRMGISRVQRSLVASQQQEGRIRQAYVDVLDAVTGGKLVLVTNDEMLRALGKTISGPHRIASTGELAAARQEIRDVCAARGMTRDETQNALSAAGEALNNLLKHAGSGEYELLDRVGLLQVKVTDKGPGIDFRTLPKAMLVPGFSTKQTLGMGFTIMLQLAERVLVCTEPGSTTILLEIR